MPNRLRNRAQMKLSVYKDKFMQMNWEEPAEGAQASVPVAEKIPAEKFM